MDVLAVGPLCSTLMLIVSTAAVIAPTPSCSTMSARVIGARDAVTPGERRAVARDDNGFAHDMKPRARGLGILNVRSGGAMPRLGCLGLAAVIAATACGRSPVAPTPVPPSSLSGSWVGSYLVSCPGAPTCGVIAGGPPAGPQAFSLLLSQDGSSLVGQINLGGWLPRVADVMGTVSADGTVTLQGGQSWPAGDFCQPAGGWRITAWNMRHDAHSGTISGAFGFVSQKHLSSCYYMSDLAVDATGVSLSRGTLAADTFTGHWQGTVVTMGCRTVGWLTCSTIPGENRFDLNLTQDGRLVTGTLGVFAGLPLTGTVEGDTLRLGAV